MAADPLDSRIRQQAFDWLAEQVEVHGDVLPRRLLERGFERDGRRIHLVGPQGIFKPRDLRLPLSITTAPSGPYDDSFSGDLLRYRYRGTDPDHRDNEGLRQSMVERLLRAYRGQCSLCRLATRSCSTPPTSSPTGRRGASRW